MSKITIFGGGKGGVGKSMSCIAFYKALKSAGKDAIVRDGDPTNPDVARTLDLSNDAAFDSNSLTDWSGLLQQASKADVILNLPGGGDALFLENAAAMGNAARIDGHQITFVSTLNRSRECLLLLKTTLDALSGAPIRPAVVINEMFKDASKFVRFNKSKVREQLAAMGGFEIVLPDLDELAADPLISPGSRDMKTATPLATMVYEKWLQKVSAEFAPLMS